MQELTSRADAKVFALGPYVMGFTSSFRMGQLLRYALDPPALSGDLDRFMCTTFIDAVRTCLKNGGWARKDSEQEEGGTFLVGVNGRLFVIHDDYQVAESVDGYAAIGSGDEVALGALYATADSPVPPCQRLTVALNAAAHHNGGVRGPFAFASTETAEQQ